MTDSPKVSHRWAPIEDVPDDHANLSKPELHTLMALWREQKAELEERETVQEFNQSLLRRWAIETGLIERLYKLDRGVTELLVERGLEAAHIPHGATDGNPEQVIKIIRDQHAAGEANGGALPSLTQFPSSVPFVAWPRPDPLPPCLPRHEPTHQAQNERRIRPRPQSEGVRLLLGLRRSQPRLPGCWNGHGVRRRLGFRRQADF